MGDLKIQYVTTMQKTDSVACSHGIGIMTKCTKTQKEINTEKN